MILHPAKEASIFFLVNIIWKGPYVCIISIIYLQVTVEIQKLLRISTSSPTQRFKTYANMLASCAHQPVSLKIV